VTAAVPEASGRPGGRVCDKQACIPQSFLSTMTITSDGDTPTKHLSPPSPAPLDDPPLPRCASSTRATTE